MENVLADLMLLAAGHGLAFLGLCDLSLALDSDSSNALWPQMAAASADFSLAAGAFLLGLFVTKRLARSRRWRDAVGSRGARWVAEFELADGGGEGGECAGIVTPLFRDASPTHANTVPQAKTFPKGRCLFEGP